MIFNTITNKDKNLEGFFSCPIGESFSEGNFCWNLLPTKRRFLGERIENATFKQNGTI